MVQLKIYDEKLDRARRKEKRKEREREKKVFASPCSALFSFACAAERKESERAAHDGDLIKRAQREKKESWKVLLFLRS